jgi:FkbM family methyltransferase
MRVYGTMKTYLQDFLKQILKKKECILFGAGKTGFDIPKYFRTKMIEVKYYCDNDSNKWGGERYGKKIVSPENLKKENDPIVIITSSYYAEIKKQLKDIGVKNIYFFSILGYICDVEEIDDGKIIEENESKIYEAENIFADKKSRETFRNILRNRLSWNDFDTKEEGKEQDLYFPEEIFELTDEEVYIDGGAYNGDAIRLFLKSKKNKFKKIFAFEPDAHAFKSLVHNIGKMNSPNIIFVKKGIYNINGMLNYRCGEYGTSIVNNKGECQLEVVTLDHFLEKESVSLIKMDIEGSEIQALKGAKRIIQSYKPKLSLSLYHRPTDLWEIPLLVKSMMPEYKVYLRPHLYYLSGPVCYVI